MTTPSALPTVGATCFPDRLLRQQGASPYTMARDRAPCSVLLRFPHQRLGNAPSVGTLDARDAPVISACLEHREHERGTRARRRHVRRAAIPALCHDAALRAPSHRGLLHRVVAIPRTRDARPPIALLSAPEIAALLAAPDPQTGAGRRDRTLRRLAVQTGRRVAAGSGLRGHDLTLGTGAPGRWQGQGRTERCPPLRNDTIAALRPWQRAQPSAPETPVCPSTRGGPLGRDGGAQRLAHYVATAPQHCPSFPGQRVSPQVGRHRAAMTLWPRGVDWAVIAGWRGHASLDTTQRSLHARLERTQQARETTTPGSGHPGRSQPDADL